MSTLCHSASATDTGIRATELCTLTLSNTYLEDSYIKVMGKGSKERKIPFGATTKKALLRYIHMFRPKPDRDDIDTLILSIEGTSLTYRNSRSHKAFQEKLQMCHGYMLTCSDTPLLCATS